MENIKSKNNILLQKYRCAFSMERWLHGRFANEECHKMAIRPYYYGFHTDGISNGMEYSIRYFVSVKTLCVSVQEPHGMIMREGGRKLSIVLTNVVFFYRKLTMWFLNAP